jgi:hypothetical protein
MAITEQEYSNLLDERNELLWKVERLRAALDYVAYNTYCGADAEWHFKPNYDPQSVLDALANEQEG